MRCTQVSVLGPLLFLLYINDIQYCSSKLQLFLFADNTNAVYAHKDLQTLRFTVTAELHSLYNWLTPENLFLNIKKIKLCNFSSIQKNLNYDPQIKSMFLTMKATKRLPFNVKASLNVMTAVSWWNSIMEDPYSLCSNKISKTIGLLATLRYNTWFHTELIS